MPEITVIQNDACFIGALDSILKDCGCDNTQYYDIMQTVQSETKGIVTNIEPSNLRLILKSIFQNTYLIDVMNIIDLRNNLMIDNINSFGLLFWLGDTLGRNRHVTRLISKNNNTTIQMDPQLGIIKSFNNNELNAHSPNGFKLVILSKQ